MLRPDIENDGEPRSPGEETDHYHLLQIDPDAPHALIIEAYWYVAGKLRAEQPVKRGVERELDAINAAYTELVNPERRHAYDATVPRVQQLRRARAKAKAAEQSPPLLTRLLRRLSAQHSRPVANYYAVLAVDPQAEAPLIARAHAILHALRSGSDSAGRGAVRSLAELDEAYSALLDGGRRAAYDRSLSAAAKQVETSAEEAATTEGESATAAGPLSSASTPNVTLLPSFLPLATRMPRSQQRSALRRLLPLAVLVSLIYWVRVERRIGCRSHMRGTWFRLEAPAWPGLSRLAVVALLGYAAAIAAAEIVTVVVDARWGVGLHVAILWALLLHYALAKDVSEGKALLALCLAPMIRILSLGMPLEDVELVYWFLITGVPMIVAAILVARTLGLTRDDIGLTVGFIPVQLAIGGLGVGVGIAEYFILKPDPLIDDLTWQQAWWPALILLVATGFGEELVFRGVMQSASRDLLGNAAIVFVAVVFAVLHVGYKSVADVVFVFIVALFFGWAVARTRSLLGVTLCHGIANVALYVIVPFTAIAGN